MDFNFSKESLELQDKLKTFFADHIYPNEELYEKAIIDSGDPLHIPEILNEAVLEPAGILITGLNSNFLN